MPIYVAEGAGFCTGVRVAVEKAYKVLLEIRDRKIYCLGDIIHNNDVMLEIRSRGIITADSPDEVEEGSAVLIRAHGAGKEIYDKLAEKNVVVIDATCAYVKKIHDLVKKEYEHGKKIIIIGDAAHPEITGINSWCDNNASIIDDEEHISGIPFSYDDEIAVFSQTTYEKNKYRKLVDMIKISFKNVKEFDTICKSTLTRQERADELSRKCDIMIVLGGERSSNTKKIFDICARNCKETYLAENLSKLPRDLDYYNKNIGITAGASTPANVIEEVYQHMNQSVSKEKENDLDFENAISQASMRISSGTIVKGRVIRKSAEDLYIDVSYKSDGILPIDEMTDKEEFDAIKPGDELEVYITRVNDTEGYVLLSKKKVDSLRSTDTVKVAFEEQKPLEVRIRNAVKGGLMAEYKGTGIFIPASQIKDSYVEDLAGMAGQKMNILVTEYDARKKRIVGSARTLIEKDRSRQLSAFWDSIEAGRSYEGTVKTFVDFGAFINLGPIDGLLHISEMSWSPVRHPSDIFKIGQKINVYILSYDKDRKKISLGYKKKEDDPWFGIEEEITAGDEIDVRIVRLVPFGAFAEIKPDVEGLIHISNMSQNRIGHPAELLSIDQTVHVKVLEIDPSGKRAALSMKETAQSLQEEKQGKSDEEGKNEHIEELNTSLGDVIDFNIKV